MKYIAEGPQNQRVPLQEGELDYAVLVEETQGQVGKSPEQTQG